MKKTDRGFSMVEMLIVMVIIGILAAVAFPSYQDSLIRGRRTDAKVALNDMSQRLERCFTQFGAYDADDCDIDAPTDSPEGFYSVDIDDVDAGSYTLSAAPQGAQENDVACGTLGMDNTGAHTATGDDTDRCW
jgi:type IV pilus assembly protein PilE